MRQGQEVVSNAWTSRLFLSEVWGKEPKKPNFLQERCFIMKKAILTFVLCAAMAANAFAGLVIGDLTVEWSGEVSGFTGNPSMGTYNWATNHFLYCDYGVPAATELRIGNNTNGALIGTLSKSGLTHLGSLGFFSVCATKDGVIYSGTNETAPATDFYLIRWASETDTAPTEQIPAPTAGAFIFPRALDAIGTGVDTILVSAGVDNGAVAIMTTTDGSTFAVTDITPANAAPPAGAETRCKQGVAIASATKIYGTKADGGANITALEKVGGVWQAVASFVPPAVATLDTPSPCGYASQFNALFLLGYSDAANDQISVLNGTFGNLLTSVDSGVNVGTFGYGAIDVDDELGVAYFAARGTATATPFTAVAGKITFEPYSVPLAVTGSWGLYE
jgi:hypothetical protein